MEGVKILAFNPPPSSSTMKRYFKYEILPVTALNPALPSPVPWSAYPSEVLTRDQASLSSQPAVPASKS